MALRFACPSLSYKEYLSHIVISFLRVCSGRFPLVNRQVLGTASSGEGGGGFTVPAVEGAASDSRVPGDGAATALKLDGHVDNFKSSSN